MTTRRVHQKADDPLLRRPRPKNRTVSKARARKRRASEAQKVRVYALVDARDHYRSRYSGLTDALQHHHIVKRSKGGTHTTDNVCLLTAKEHEMVHRNRLVVWGNADVLLHFMLRDKDGCVVEVGTSQPVSA